MTPAASLFARDALAALRPGDTVQAISLWEPWASLMANGAKRIETRGWATAYRGPLLICAAKRCNLGELRDLLADPDFQRGLAPLAPGRRVEISDLQFGMAVALVDLAACIRTERLAADPRCAGDLPFGDYSHGRWGWCCPEMRRIKPFPVRGEQGFFRVTLPEGFDEVASLEATR